MAEGVLASRAEREPTTELLDSGRLQARSTRRATRGTWHPVSLTKSTDRDGGTNRPFRRLWVYLSAIPRSVV
jgi:hypothetical protein